MQNVEESVFLNHISSDEEDEFESPLIQTQDRQTPETLKIIQMQQSEVSFNRFRDSRINETVVLQSHADEITQKTSKNAKEAYQREIIKELVSKQKKRFKVDGFNLDLTCILYIYRDITDNVIAMGFPAESFEAIYRNPMGEVQKFLNSRHANNYLVVNLCSERKYKHECFFKVLEFPFDDHQAPPFSLIKQCCQKIHEWLSSDPNRVVAIHCKAGKGRTGVMVCCYLLFSGRYTSSQDALTYYGLVRTQNKKGVTIPSQIRYVHYFSYALKHNLLDSVSRTVELIEVTLLNLPNGILVRLQNENKQFIAKVSNSTEKEQIFRFTDIYLQGDVLIQVFQKSIVSESKLLQAWFNTQFVSVSPQEQSYKFHELDLAKKMHKNHQNIEMYLLFDELVQTRGRSNCMIK